MPISVKIAVMIDDTDGDTYIQVVRNETTAPFHMLHDSFQLAGPIVDRLMSEVGESVKEQLVDAVERSRNLAAQMEPGDQRGSD